MNKIKKIIKKLFPEELFLQYHKVKALVASTLYGHPTDKMIVIGITGTKGKTSAGNFLWSVLNNNGLKTGLTGTANIRIGDEELINQYHMTMPGPFVLQKFFKQMLNAGCKYCIVETTSEGIKQYRHIGINYDWVIFTNLTPEHLPSHGGSFDEYKKKKGELFAVLKNHQKTIGDKSINSLSIINNDAEHHEFFASFPADKKITYGLKSGDYLATNISGDENGVSFQVKDNEYKLNIVGSFNIYNALPAIIAGQEAGLSPEQIKSGLAKLNLIPGRMEKIDLGQDFTVIVDYAHEKESMTRAMETAEMIRGHNPDGKIIVSLGAEGGGRDKAKRPLMGEIVGKRADYVVVSNVDPYEDDPIEIIEDIARVVEQNGKKRNENLFTIADRRDGIRKCLELAHPGDVVMITGKGAEQSITIGGVASPWDDREVVKEELAKILKK